jgi:hypothetical protein
MLACRPCLFAARRRDLEYTRYPAQHPPVRRVVGSGSPKRALEVRDLGNRDRRSFYSSLCKPIVTPYCWLATASY